MGYQVRSFRLPDETNAIIAEAKERCGCRSDTEALIRIVSDSVHLREQTISDAVKEAIIRSVVNQIRREFKRQLDQIRCSGAETERCCHLILDAINTMLYDSSATFLMEAKGQLRHEVIRQSEENYTKMIEHRKQIRDNKRWKEGVMEHGRDPDPGT